MNYTWRASKFLPNFHSSNPTMPAINDSVCYHLFHIMGTERFKRYTFIFTCIEEKNCYAALADWVD